MPAIDPTQLRLIIDEALRDSSNFPGLHYAITFAIASAAAFFGAFFAGYLRRKGEHLADKEDIEVLTRLVENIKIENAERIESLAHANRLILAQGSQEHQMRIAAIDRRLTAHQEAFTLWNKLLNSVYSEKIGEVAMECQDWWIKNCLYLDAGSRQSFRRSYMCASQHTDFLHGRADMQLIKDNWADITSAGEAIVKGAALPALKGEDKDIPLPKDGARDIL